MTGKDACRCDSTCSDAPPRLPKIIYSPLNLFLTPFKSRDEHRFCERKKFVANDVVVQKKTNDLDRLFLKNEQFNVVRTEQTFEKTKQ